ncbi:MAG: class I SAM-dependent methyltransferase [Algicola sp.]|nr:class I SAM-dependent methyltransferase [Algicola sp.]
MSLSASNFKANLCKISLMSFLLVSSTIAASTEKNTDLASVYKTAISSAQRPAADLKKDKTRKPSKILPFSQIKPGDKVYEIGAGGGYTTELLARVVGKSGKVLAHRLFNAKRVEGGRLPNIITLRDHTLFELRDVFTENHIGKNELDAVIVFFILHDTYLNAEMDQSILKTLYSYLKPEGVLVILDNAADADSGLTSTKKLHRIGENLVIADLEKAGFVVDGTSDVLRNNQDDHTKPWGEFAGSQDRFAIRFKKKTKQ